MSTDLGYSGREDIIKLLAAYLAYKHTIMPTREQLHQSIKDFFELRKKDISLGH